MNEEVLIPLVLFGSITVILWLLFLFRYRAKQDVQRTIQLSIEKDREISPEFLERMVNPPAPPNRDLRRGILWTGFALGSLLVGLFFPVGDVRPFIYAGSMLPLLVGIAYILLHRFGGSA